MYGLLNVKGLSRDRRVGDCGGTVTCPVTTNFLREEMEGDV